MKLSYAEYEELPFSFLFQLSLYVYGFCIYFFKSVVFRRIMLTPTYAPTYALGSHRISDRII